METKSIFRSVAAASNNTRRLQLLFYVISVDKCRESFQQLTIRNVCDTTDRAVAYSQESVVISLVYVTHFYVNEGMGGARGAPLQYVFFMYINEV